MAEACVRKRVIEHVEAVEHHTVTKTKKVEALVTTTGNTKEDISYESTSLRGLTSHTVESDRQVSICSPYSQSSPFAVLDGESNKYCMALQKLYVDIPTYLRNPETLSAALFAAFVINNSQKELLQNTLKNENSHQHNRKLLDMLLEKTDKDIIKFLKVLDSENQKKVADIIRETADTLESNRQHESIFSSRQLAHQIGKKSINIGQDITSELNSQGKGYENRDLDLRLQTMCLPDFSNEAGKTLVKKEGHLQISLTFLTGSNKTSTFIKHNVYKMKSKLTKALKIPCSCSIEDERQQPKDDATKEPCGALVSIGFKDGEREAFEIFESQLLDFENFLCEQTASIVSIIEECIKIKIRVHDKKHLESIQHDIENGNLLKRISFWLEEHGYVKGQGTDALMLTVDINDLERLKDAMESEEAILEENQDKILSFPVSYTFCPHSSQWFWSADKKYWFDIYSTRINIGYYQNYQLSDADCMILHELQNDDSIRPPGKLEYCIICNRYVEESQMTTTGDDRLDDVTGRRRVRNAEWNCATCELGLNRASICSHLSNKEQNIHIIHPVDCLEHENHKIIKFCLDCNKYICLHCLRESHLQHKLGMPVVTLTPSNDEITQLTYAVQFQSTSLTLRKAVLYFAIIVFLAILANQIMDESKELYRDYMKPKLQLYYINDEIWIPHSNEHYIEVLSRDRRKLRHLTFPKHTYIYPKVVHQISKNEILLAGASGIFLLDSKGNIEHMISEGRYNDLYTNEYGAVVASEYNRKLHVSISCLRQQHPEITFGKIFEDTINSKGKNSVKHNTVYESFDTTLRMSLVGDEIWIPEEFKSTIRVVSLKTKKTRLIKLYTIEPVAIEQGCHNEVLIASRQGVLVMKKSSPMYSVVHGKFADISVDGNVAVALHSYKDRIITLACYNDMWNAQKEIFVYHNLEKYPRSMYLNRGVIYLSSYEDSIIHTYSVSGSYLQQLNSKGTQLPGQFIYPRICGTDIDGSLLSCDTRNNRFQVLSKNQEWKIYQLEGIAEPTDVIVTANKMYVLWKSPGGSYKITEFSSKNYVKVFYVDSS